MISFAASKQKTMAQQDVYLDTKVVDSISGKFIVKSYQRGYRWDVQVKTLLDDIWENGDKDYCLQPVVIRNDGDEYELIDGQQRLTTLFIILKYIQEKTHINKIKFSIDYENRQKSADYLQNIDAEHAGENIDFYFIYNAYKAVDEWFKSFGDDAGITAFKMYQSLHDHVKVIWYEVDATADTIALFTRLNIGRIPLTNAELIKALFLNRNNEIDSRRQIEISMQWDDIECELQNKSLWYFLTNKDPDSYPTKIDLLFEFMTTEPIDPKEKYATFFFFAKQKKACRSTLKLWDSIRRTFLLLKEWYEDRTLYHKIGYLIASNTMDVKQIIGLSIGKTKSEFMNVIDASIAESIRLADERSYMELSYENKADQVLITKILLLLNVLSVCSNGSKQRYPFDEHKEANWSLEHIHAQQSEGLNNKVAMQEWLSQHVESVMAVNADGSLDELIEKIDQAKNDDKLTQITFSGLYSQIVSCLSDSDDPSSYMHYLTNMALLKGTDNAALSNAVFDAKRNQIIRMDKDGQFIPFCTRMVFLKYYSPSKEIQIHYWSHADREAYRRNMNDVLAPYLKINNKEI